MAGLIHIAHCAGFWQVEEALGRTLFLHGAEVCGRSWLISLGEHETYVRLELDLFRNILRRFYSRTHDLKP